MLAGFKPLKPLFHVETDKLSDEERYWNRLKEVSVFQETGNITSTEFLPIDPFHVASTFNAKLSVYDTKTCEPIPVSNKINSALRCVTFRADGSVAGVGTQDGQIRLFRVDPTKRKRFLQPIQKFPNAHGHAVNCVAFAPSGVNFASMASDGAVKFWDLADSRGADASPIWSVAGAHADHINTGVFSTRNDHLLVTGAYDHKIKVWDVRTKENDGIASIMEMNHGVPVEKVLLFPNETIVASAAGHTIKLWDIAAGGKLLHTIEGDRDASKKITSMCFATNKTYLLSAGLDRKIILHRCNSGDFKRVKVWKMAAPILSLSMSADDQSMAFGMANLLSIYRRKTEKELRAAQLDLTNVGEEKSNGGMNSSNFHEDYKLKRKRTDEHHQQFFVDVNSYSPNAATRRVAAPQVQTHERGKVRPDGALKTRIVQLTARHNKQLKLGGLDIMLRERRLRDFFATAILKCGSRPEFVVAAFQQLQIRQKVHLALSGHPENVLHEFVKFMGKNLFKSPFFDTLYDVLNAFFTVYADEKLSTELIAEIEALKESIFVEIDVQRELSKILGVVSMISHRPAVQMLQNAEQNASTISPPSSSLPSAGLTAESGEEATKTPEKMATSEGVIVVKAERAKQTAKSVVWVI